MSRITASSIKVLEEDRGGRDRLNRDLSAFLTFYQLFTYLLYQLPPLAPYTPHTPTNHGYPSQHGVSGPARGHTDIGTRTFAVDLVEQMERDGVEVPKIVVKCCEAIERYGLTSQGIYRVNGTQTKIQKLKELMDRGDPS
jgi:hypothetical protein